MRIKSYSALDMGTALKKVKNELGPEAIILSTRRIPDESGLGAVVEVTAMPPQNGHGGANGKNGHSGARHGPAARAPQPARPASAVLEEALGGEISQIKSMLLNLTYRTRLPEKLREKTELTDMLHLLMENEVDENLAQGLVARVGAELNGGGVPARQILKAKLARLLKTTAPLEPSGPGEPPLVAVLVGPSGCGKTTTTAKLAASMQLKKKHRVAIISLDAYRLGAAEQLRTYSHIMGLPFRLAQDKDEFKQSIELFEDMDLILVDTPGRCLAEEARLDELGRMMELAPGARSLLVASATTKDRALAAAIRRAEPLDQSGLIITMLDETDAYGNVINNLVKFKQPVAYLADGQKVPEDLRPATAEMLACLALGERAVK